MLMPSLMGEYNFVANTGDASDIQPPHWHRFRRIQEVPVRGSVYIVHLYLPAVEAIPNQIRKDLRNVFCGLVKRNGRLILVLT